MGFMTQIRPEVLKKLREDYPTGCRVELVQMFVEPRKDMVPGLTGEVMFVDDAVGIHVAWSNGSTLAAITAVAPGTALEYVASVFNGWQAVKTGSQVGWVSGEYSEITSE